MKGILYRGDGHTIEVLSDENNYGYYLPAGFGFQIKNNTCVILVVDSFGFNFEKIHNENQLKNAIDLYIKKYGDIDNVLFILNEIIVDDESNFIKFSKRIGKDCFYANFDMMNVDKKYQLFLPLSLYSQVDWLLDRNYLPAIPFLKEMNRGYHDLIKPYKLAFYSNHVSPTRIDIFNILKWTGNLKNAMWSFNNSLVYYSGEKHNLDSFFTDNKGLIPYSFDRYSEKTINLKHTYLSHFLCYFEIVAESYFFKDIKSLNNHCPITEKLIKPIVACLPFIVFGPKNLKKTLESIGMKFTSPLYGFYDTCDANSCDEGYGHVIQQSTNKIENLHKVYFEYINEYENNAEVLINFFQNHKKNIHNFLHTKNTTIKPAFSIKSTETVNTEVISNTLKII
jgi:hypothetical protein